MRLVKEGAGSVAGNRSGRRRRVTKVPLVFAAELSGAIVAYHVSGLADILASLDERLRPVQLYRLRILQRRHMHHVPEVLVKSGAAHMNHFCQIFH